MFSELQVTQDLPHSCLEVTIPVFGGTGREHARLEHELFNVIGSSAIAEPVHVNLGVAGGAAGSDHDYRVLRIVTMRSADVSELDAAVAVAAARAADPARAGHSG